MTTSKRVSSNSIDSGDSDSVVSGSGISDAELIEITHDALIANSLLHQQLIGPGFAVRSDDLVAVARPSLASADTSCGYRTDHTLDAHEFLERITTLFDDHGVRSYEILCRTGLDDDIDLIAGEFGLERPWPDFPRLVVEQPVSEVDSVDVVRITTPSQLSIWHHIVGTAFAPGQTVDSLKIDYPIELMNAEPDLQLLLAFDATEPVAAGCVYMHGEVAYVRSIATLREHRRKGFGSALVRRATNLGFESGARVTCLFAREGAEHIYERVGYREISRIHHWVMEPAAEAVRA